MSLRLVFTLEYTFKSGVGWLGVGGGSWLGGWSNWLKLMLKLRLATKKKCPVGALELQSF